MDYSIRPQSYNMDLEVVQEIVKRETLSGVILEASACWCLIRHSQRTDNKKQLVLTLGPN